MMNKQINFKFIILNFKFILVLFVYLYICLFVYSHNVKAQQVSLSLSPPLIEAVIKPGKSIMIAYNLKNYGDPTHINVRVVSFEPKDNLGQILLKQNLEGPVRFNLDNADIKFDVPFFMKTSSFQQILLKMRVPENIPSGDYYYSLLAETVPSASLEGVGSAQSQGYDCFKYINNCD